MISLILLSLNIYLNILEVLLINIFNYLEKDELPLDEKLARKLSNMVANYDIVDGILYHFWKPTGKASRKTDCIRQVVIPRSLRNYVIKRAHDCVLGGHLGYSKTLGVLRQRYFGERMPRDINMYIKTCAHCHTRKRAMPPTHSKLLPIPVSGPWDRLGMDIVGPLPRSYDGQKYIFYSQDELQNSTSSPLLLNEGNYNSNSNISFQYGSLCAHWL